MNHGHGSGCYPGIFVGTARIELELFSKRKIVGVFVPKIGRFWVKGVEVRGSDGIFYTRFLFRFLSSFFPSLCNLD